MQANIELRENRERAERKLEELQGAQHQLQQLEGADRVDDEVRRLEGEISAGQLESAKMDGMLKSVSQRATDTKTQVRRDRCNCYNRCGLLGSTAASL